MEKGNEQEKQQEDGNWKGKGVERKEKVEEENICNHVTRETGNEVAWKGKAEGRYQAISLNPLLSITSPCFHHSHFRRARQGQTLQSPPAQRVWLCWET